MSSLPGVLRDVVVGLAPLIYSDTRNRCGLNKLDVFLNSLKEQQIYSWSCFGVDLKKKRNPIVTVT